MEDRLRKFAALIDAGSFTAAASELHLSQPALSAAVHKLERELKTALIVHGVRPLKLTPAGQLAYSTAKELTVSTENLHMRLAELAKADIRLRIGMIDSIAGTVFADPHALADMEDRVQLAVTVNNSRYLLQAVEHDELDMALVAVQPGALSPLLETRSLADEPLVIVCHRAMYAAAHAQALAGTLGRFMSYDQLSTTQRLVQGALAARGITLRTDFYSTSPEVMLRLVLLRQGIAALPYRMVAEYVADGTLCMLGGDAPWIIPRGIVLAKRRDKELAPPLARLGRQVRRALEGLAADAAGVDSARA